MRKLAITFLVLLVLAVAGMLLLPYFLDVNSYRGRIQAELEQRLHRSVTLGAMQLNVLPLAFRVENVAIAEDPAFGPRKNFAEADRIRDELAALGVVLKDGKDGTTWELAR